MQLDFQVENTIKTRSSIRTYEEKPLSKEDKNKLKEYMESSLVNPFSVNVLFRLLEQKNAVNGEKLGTYGVIKGAIDFIGATVENSELALEALGYSFEKLVLYATSIGLGTCFLGGTFNRSSFAAAMEVKENELFPVISPVGYPFGKKRVKESIMRWAIKADKRKEWDELFFNEDFSSPLTKKDAGKYAFPLEMLRLAPSAANKQPWRVVQDKNGYHFYELKTIGDSNKIDIQRVDIGIAACNFHMAAVGKDLSGRFEKLNTTKLETPDNLKYIFSWIIK